MYWPAESVFRALLGRRVHDRVGRSGALVGNPLKLVVAHRRRF
jgi:hypothetical protein